MSESADNLLRYIRIILNRPRADVHVLHLARHQRHKVGRNRRVHRELEDPVLFGVRTPRRTHQHRDAIWNLETKRTTKTRHHVQRLRYTSPAGQGSKFRTHPDGSCVRAFNGGRVEAGEEGAVTHRVTLSEDERTRLTTGQLRVQPPDLRERKRERGGGGPIIVRTFCERPIDK